MAFENLDKKSDSCFGRTPESERPGWVQLAEMSISDGWKTVDVKKIESDLAKNVLNSYMKICQVDAEDLDSKTIWHAEFNNDLGSWQVSIANSPEAVPEEEDITGFLQSSFFKEFAINAGQTIDKAVRVYNEVLDSHLEEGELLEVDEVKLARILYQTNLKWWMDNLRQGVYSISRLA